MASTKEKMWCPLCAKRGLKRRVRIYQLNFKEAIRLCSSKKCDYTGDEDEDDMLIPRRLEDLEPSIKVTKSMLSDADSISSAVSEASRVSQQSSSGYSSFLTSPPQAPNQSPNHSSDSMVDKEVEQFMTPRTTRNAFSLFQTANAPLTKTKETSNDFMLEKLDLLGTERNKTDDAADIVLRELLDSSDKNIDDTACDISDFLLDGLFDGNSVDDAASAQGSASKHAEMIHESSRVPKMDSCTGSCEQLSAPQCENVLIPSPASAFSAYRASLSISSPNKHYAPECKDDERSPKVASDTSVTMCNSAIDDDDVMEQNGSEKCSCVQQKELNNCDRCIESAVPKGCELKMGEDKADNVDLLSDGDESGIEEAEMEVFTLGSDEEEEIVTLRGENESMPACLKPGSKTICPKEKDELSQSKGGGQTQSNQRSGGDCGQAQSEVMDISDTEEESNESVMQSSAQADVTQFPSQTFQTAENVCGKLSNGPVEVDIQHQEVPVEEVSATLDEDERRMCVPDFILPNSTSQLNVDDASLHISNGVNPVNRHEGTTNCSTSEDNDIAETPTTLISSVAQYSKKPHPEAESNIVPTPTLPSSSTQFHKTPSVLPDDIGNTSLNSENNINIPSFNFTPLQKNIEAIIPPTISATTDGTNIVIRHPTPDLPSWGENTLQVGSRKLIIVKVNNTTPRQVETSQPGCSNENSNSGNVVHKPTKRQVYQHVPNPKKVKTTQSVSDNGTVLHKPIKPRFFPLNRNVPEPVQLGNPQPASFNVSFNGYKHSFRFSSDGEMLKFMTQFKEQEELALAYLQSLDIHSYNAKSQDPQQFAERTVPVVPDSALLCSAGTSTNKDDNVMVDGEFADTIVVNSSEERELDTSSLAIDRTKTYSVSAQCNNVEVLQSSCASSQSSYEAHTSDFITDSSHKSSSSRFKCSRRRKSVVSDECARLCAQEPVCKIVVIPHYSQDAVLSSRRECEGSSQTEGAACVTSAMPSHSSEMDSFENNTYPGVSIRMGSTSDSPRCKSRLPFKRSLKKMLEYVSEEFGATRTKRKIPKPRQKSKHRQEYNEKFNALD